MKDYSYVKYLVFFMICGVIHGIYDNYKMDQELKDIIIIEYSKPIKVKKRVVRLFRDGRARILNDSFGISFLYSFDETFYLNENWANVDSLIKGPNTDTLRCILYSGEVVYLRTSNE